MTYSGPVLRNQHCLGLGAVYSDHAVYFVLPLCVPLPKPVALLLARSNQIYQSHRTVEQKILQVLRNLQHLGGKILLMLLLKERRQNGLVNFNSMKSSWGNVRKNVPVSRNLIKNTSPLRCQSVQPEDTRH